MTSTLGQLADVMAADPMVHKVLVVQSFAEGNLLLNWICQSVGQVMNVDVHTVESLAEEQSRLALYQRGYSMIRPQHSFWVIRHFMEELSAQQDAYIGKGLITPQVVRRVHRAVMDLRYARVTQSELAGGHFLNENKGLYLEALLTRYEQYLKENKLVDVPGLLPYAKSGPAGTLYVTIERIKWRRAERELLQKIAGERVITLASHASFTEVASGFPLQHASFFHANGQLAEVREVFRRIISKKIPLSDIELIAGDSSYHVAVHMAASELGLPCTFSRGLPVESTNVGVAAWQALQWIEDGFPLEALLKMLRLGQIKLVDSDAALSSADCMRILEKANIGWGMERYTDLLDPHSATIHERDRELVGALQSLFKSWFESLSAGEVWQPIRLFHWLVHWLSAHVCIRHSEDAAVLSALKEKASELEKKHHLDASLSKNEAIAYVRMMIRDMRVYVSPLPEPGKLHVSSLDDGALSGRNVTFLVGMDARNWSMNERQDPVLLDEERRSISPDLLTSEQAAQMRLAERRSRLGMIRGEVTLSYTSYDVAEKKENPPAYEMLQLYRLASGDLTADYAKLNAQITGPVSYVPTSTPAQAAQSALHLSDYVLGECRTESGRWADGWSVIGHVFPDMSKGREARAAKEEQLTVTDYDGLVSPHIWQQYKEQTKQSALSASQLETYAACPLRYYFQYVLNIRKKEMTEYDRSRWLTPLERGNLLHRVYYLYWKNEVGSDRAALTALTDQVLNEYKRIVPVPSEIIYAKECEEIHRDLDVFFAMEQESLYTPVFLEQELSIDGEPIVLELGEDVTIRLKGFVDRIDQVGPHEYRIIDYKTGSASVYKENAFYAGGTQLQHALYTVAAEKWLQQTGYDPKARVREGAYYFPTERGRGEQVIRVENCREELSHLLKKLLDSMDRGIFIPTKEVSHCRYCDYQSGCGIHAEYMKEKREQPINHRLLEPLLEVESID